MRVIKFSCPACNQGIEAPANIRGQIVACPTCDEKFPVPKLVTWTEPIVIFIFGFVLFYALPGIRFRISYVGIILQLASLALILYGLCKAFYVASRRHGFLAAAGSTLIVGGIIFMLVAWLSEGSLPGLIVGGVLTLLGAAFIIGSLIKRSPQN